MNSILVVDDSEFMRYSICQLIKRNNLATNVLEAADGVEAVKLYKDAKPDLVTMDMDMPKANGIQALRAIKKVDSCAKIVVITSNQSTMQDSSKFGAVGFLTKPIDESVAIKTISSVMQKVCQKISFTKIKPQIPN